MNIYIKPEYELNSDEINGIKKILSECFFKYYVNREYFKQVAHHRILAEENGKIIGQLALDYRMMSLNKKAIKVWGILDVCVSPEKQGNGIATQLLKKAEEIARKHKLDFMLLFADDPSLYENNGFIKCGKNNIKWLKIDKHEMLGLGEEVISELMIKEIGDMEWETGELDMLGYLY